MYGHPIEPGGSFALVCFVLGRFGNNLNENKVRRKRPMR